MRRILILGLLLGVLAMRERSAADALPQIRPPLLSPGKQSLVNLIDTAALMKNGQGSVSLAFNCPVGDRGESPVVEIPPFPDAARPLAKELQKQNERARYIPAVYNHQTTAATLAGTLLFVVRDGKPHLRVMLTQDEDHLKKGDDFISPQIIYWQKNPSAQFTSPDLDTAALVVFKLKTDVEGKVLDAKIVSELPKDQGFGARVLRDVHRVIFSPAYLHGKPVATTTTMHLFFTGNGFNAI